MTKKRVNMKLREMRVEPIKATFRHSSFSINMQTIGLRKSGTDCINPVVMKTRDSASSFLKYTINSLVKIPKDSETPSSFYISECL